MWNWLTWLWGLRIHMICKLDTQESCCCNSIEVRNYESQGSRWCKFQSKGRRRQMPQLQQAGRKRITPSFLRLLFHSDRQQIGWDPPTQSGESTISNAHLISHTRPELMFSLGTQWPCQVDTSHWSGTNWKLLLMQLLITKMPLQSHCLSKIHAVKHGTILETSVPKFFLKPAVRVTWRHRGLCLWGSAGLLAGGAARF